MNAYSNKSTLHGRIKNFVAWIAPPKESRAAIKDKSDEVRKNIKEKAEADGLTIIEMPHSGSFATRTGLRRHMRGLTTTEGQDIDLPFVVEKDKETEFEPLIQRFKKYAEDCYPNNEIEETKSSIKIIFEADKLTFDLVPMFQGSKKGEQILIRNTGEQITTCIENHREFIRSRTAETKKNDGIVTFNDMIRLLKWWRIVKENETNDKISLPSFLVNLLAAKAYEQCGDDTTYPQTLANWFSYLAHVVKNKETIWFNDYYQSITPHANQEWSVLDPVMAENNIVKKWSWYEIQDLADWLQEASEIINRAIVADIDGRDGDSLEHLQSLFGKIFSSHCN
ncbi:CBASS oligonucleotide cyclase [Pedobacter jeongneungensis]|uniref:CBASS oligonucleotide cyclase n=1 Tax=Pedobacter jeongneungensis TaxID=947309 RepID=UPI00046A3E8C|nr:CBASS oligonucleotide cyclase [Pedobacter jeongneungensis]